MGRKLSWFVFALLFGFGSVSCTALTLKRNENSNVIYYGESPDPAFDFSVLMHGVKHFGWDGEDPKDRRDMILEKYRSSCKSIGISKEYSIKLEDNEYNSWVMLVKCFK